MKRVWSWREVLKAFLKVCYRVANQKGSHITIIPKCVSAHDRTLPVTIPKHNEIKRGTLSSILARGNITKIEFINLVNDP